ncbi:hypothetical protein [Dyella sp. 2HG41-7]|uniref:glycosyl hydrolase family 95 catalytic domain-containing protein n=1 Tax=Dyella sp. 2HG41-7 TaxID=2883239 RepID=UPI001F202FCB|nr:hypothetical protein [Dyella sp. 2HG41-7]
MSGMRRRACLALICVFTVVAGHAQNTTAWRDGRFEVDVPGVVSRSDIVLLRPNLQPDQAMPLGNGRLGAAVWSADGMTLQLNRADTLPDRLSPGEVTIPVLQTLTRAADYRGRLDLYNGEFVESGGGMTAKAHIEPDSDVLVIDVTGADPGKRSHVTLQWWAPRTAQIDAHGAVGVLWQSWKDDHRQGQHGDTPPGFSGRTFGALAGVTVQARDVRASTDGKLAVTIDFMPRQDGSFRVLIASPAYAGGAPDTVKKILTADIAPARHAQWWHDFWAHTGLMRLQSADGVAQYMENLRAINLYAAVAERGDDHPGSQAGMGDLFSSRRDQHAWDPAAFWHWNLRGQIAANLGAGLANANLPYFHLYLENLDALKQWTRTHMQRDGICVPETMRFNGQGYEFETWATPQTALDCDAQSEPFYNARTLSTGAEVALWIWRQYRVTGDTAFLREHYPWMAEAARFLLSYAKPGDDGLLHTAPSNAHETQWDVRDPTTDLAAMRALFAATSDAAKQLGQDAPLVEQMQAALKKLPPLPRTDAATQKQMLAANADVSGTDVIAASYQPAAEAQNIENIGLEPVWPYETINDASPLFALAQRTFQRRPHPVAIDWSFDPLQAALLQKPDDVASTLYALTDRFQAFPNGFASLFGWKRRADFYVEQGAVVSAALQAALVWQGDDGLIRIAQAWPKDWDADGQVYIDGQSRVDVQVRHGQVTNVVIEAGSTSSLDIRNPWSGEAVDVMAGTTRLFTVPAGKAIFALSTKQSVNYLLRPASMKSWAFAPVTGMPAQQPKRLGRASIGLFAH